MLEHDTRLLYSLILLFKQIVYIAVSKNARVWEKRRVFTNLAHIVGSHSGSAVSPTATDKTYHLRDLLVIKTPAERRHGYRRRGSLQTRQCLPHKSNVNEGNSVPAHYHWVAAQLREETGIPTSVGLMTTCAAIHIGGSSDVAVVAFPQLQGNSPIFFEWFLGGVFGRKRF